MKNYKKISQWGNEREFVLARLNEFHSFLKTKVKVVIHC